MPKEEKVCWYVTITRNGQWKNVGRRLGERGVDHYIPPTYRTMVFLHTTKSNALSLVNSGEIKGRFLIDHNTRSLLEVPQKQMDDFIRILDLSPDAECLSSVPLAKGDRVRVVKGALSGVEGDIVETPDGLYLTVSVLSLLCARVEIPKSYVVPIKTK
jgi:hypothetical protein